MKRIIFRKSLAIFLTLLTIFCTAFMLACREKESYETYLTELKTDVFKGDNETLSLKAQYGFNKAENSATESRVYGLYFYLLGVDGDNITRTISMAENGKTYADTFALNPVTDKTTAFIEIENFTKKTFTVTISEGSNRYEITLSSILPEKTITYKDALTHLQTEHGNFLDAYKTADGKFNAKLIMRVIVKDNKSYWYVGLIDDSDSLKAFLLDGISGKTLAVREVF